MLTLAPCQLTSKGSLSPARMALRCLDGTSQTPTGLPNVNRSIACRQRPRAGMLLGMPTLLVGAQTFQLPGVASPRCAQAKGAAGQGEAAVSQGADQGAGAAKVAAGRAEGAAKDAAGQVGPPGLLLPGVSYIARQAGQEELFARG